MANVWISALGNALPGRAISQEDAVAWMLPRLHPDASRERFAHFAKRSGVGFRIPCLIFSARKGIASIRPVARALPP